MVILWKKEKSFFTSLTIPFQLEVRVEHETIWLTQAQLEASSTCAKNAQVQKEGARTVLREVNYYNLDSFGR